MKGREQQAQDLFNCLIQEIRDLYHGETRQEFHRQVANLHTLMENRKTAQPQAA